MLEIHDRAAELTSAPVKREGAGVERGQQQIMSYNPSPNPAAVL
jgi:hypothetical protein